MTRRLRAAFWHTQFCAAAPATPHEIQINLGASYQLTAFQYLPRQDGSACGWIKQYEFYVSLDGVNWGTAVATGTFNYGSLSTKCPGPGAGVPSALQIVFPPATGHYVRLRALSELNGNPWTSAAEINVLGALASGQSAALASVSLNPTTVVGGGSSTGTVTLSAPAPAGGAVVSLSSGNTAVATVPASVTVPASAISATFTVNTSAVSSATQVNISGSYNGGGARHADGEPGQPDPADQLVGFLRG
jgi:F5/8 type C domain-containing protein